MSVTLLLVAVISITTATYAWFTLTNSTVVHNMTVEVSTGTTLKARTAFSTDLGAYSGVIDNAMVNAQIKNTLGFELTGSNALKLFPVSSGNGMDFYTYSRNNATTRVPNEPTEGYYLQLILWFMSDADLDVYLNGDNSKLDTDPKNDDGTKIYTADVQQDADRAARLSITPYALRAGGTATNENHYDKEEPTLIYQPVRTGETAEDVTLTGQALADLTTGSVQKSFSGLGDNLGINDGTKKKTPALFHLTANVPKKVVLTLWLEGEDPECINDPKGINLPGEMLTTRLRFSGANADGNFFE